MITKSIKIVIALLLFICIFKMPYGYYQFVRIAALIGFAVLAYDSYKNGQKVLSVIFVGLAILFQPVSKIILPKETWQIIDVIVGVFLLTTILIKTLKKQNS